MTEPVADQVALDAAYRAWEDYTRRSKNWHPHDGIMMAVHTYAEALWQPIETAPPNTRIIASGYQPPTGTVAGYWWTEEDWTDDAGKPMLHPSAARWHPWPTPPEEV